MGARAVPRRSGFSARPRAEGGHPNVPPIFIKNVYHTDFLVTPSFLDAPRQTVSINGMPAPRPKFAAGLVQAVAQGASARAKRARSSCKKGELGNQYDTRF